MVASLRWQALLEPARHLPLTGVVAATMMGQTASAVTPIPAAEFIRPYLLSKQQGVDFGAVLATATAEWLLDAFAILVLFIPAAAWQRAGDARITHEAWSVAAPVLFLSLALGGLAVLRFLPRWGPHIAGATRWREMLSPQARIRVAGWCQSFAVGLRSLDRRSGLVTIAGYSLLMSALTAAASWLALTAFGLPVSFAAGFLLLGIVAVAGMSPTPGAVGGFHAVCQMGLMAFFHVDRTRTVLPVIALHAVLYMPGAFIGALCFLLLPGRLRSEG